VLPPDVAARIAAGEVVERPASVVKELVENSIDAGASRISVEITGGGLTLIKVTDDGCGIDAAELTTAFERHATSKFDDQADVGQVRTLGFRGEALPSIAAVASVELTSRPLSQESANYLRIAPEDSLQTGSRGASPGTAISVGDLFARVPARRSFLRSPGSEANAVASVVSHYALAYPEVRFRLAVDGRQTFHTPGSGDLRDAVAAVYGLDVAAEMLVVQSGDGSIRVSGLTGPPQLSRASRSYISIFVNRRWIQNRRITFAVDDAYQGLLMVGRHPIAVINITLPIEEVDVNVHPTKAEVRFREEAAVFGAVQKAVRASVMDSAPVPVAVRGSSPLPDAPPLTLTAPAWTPPLWEAALRREAGSADGAQPTGDGWYGPADMSVTAGAGGIRGDAAPTTANGEARTPTEALPLLRVIGQFGNVYIITEGPEAMYLIDQHAAHERVLYDRFATLRRDQRPDAQGLLAPIPLELPPRLASVLESETTALAGHGFELEPFGDASILLRAVPQSLARGDVRDNVLRFLDVLLDEESSDGRDRVAMSLACHGAIRAGKQLALDEMRELVRLLETTETPHTCPHGRPTMIHVSADMLARGFGRR
jgi:DNA mismatch repair protein MutL